MNEMIRVLLSYNHIDPDAMAGDQTAFQVMEAAIQGALDTIEESQ